MGVRPARRRGHSSAAPGPCRVSRPRSDQGHARGAGLQGFLRGGPARRERRGPHDGRRVGRRLAIRGAEVEAGPGGPGGRWPRPCLASRRLQGAVRRGGNGSEPRRCAALGGVPRLRLVLGPLYEECVVERRFGVRFARTAAACKARMVRGWTGSIVRGKYAPGTSALHHSHDQLDSFSPETIVSPLCSCSAALTFLVAITSAREKQ